MRFCIFSDQDGLVEGVLHSCSHIRGSKEVQIVDIFYPPSLPQPTLVLEVFLHFSYFRYSCSLFRESLEAPSCEENQEKRKIKEDLRDQGTPLPPLNLSEFHIRLMIKGNSCHIIHQHLRDYIKVNWDQSVERLSAVHTRHDTQTRDTQP